MKKLLLTAVIAFSTLSCSQPTENVNLVSKGEVEVIFSGKVDGWQRQTSIFKFNVPEGTIYVVQHCNGNAAVFVPKK